MLFCYLNTNLYNMVLKNKINYLLNIDFLKILNLRMRRTNE